MRQRTDFHGHSSGAARSIRFSILNAIAPRSDVPFCPAWVEQESAEIREGSQFFDIPLGLLIIINSHALKLASGISNSILPWVNLA
jgi:hypothetical protein